MVVTPKPKSYAERLFGLHRQVWEGVDPDAYMRAFLRDLLPPPPPDSHSMG